MNRSFRCGRRAGAKPFLTRRRGWLLEHFVLAATLLWFSLGSSVAGAQAAGASQSDGTQAQVSCEVRTMGKTYWVNAAPTLERYRVAATPVSKRFRFRLLVSGLEQRIDSIQIDVQATTERQPILVHQAILTPPFAPIPALLNGENRVYSPEYERELWYRCQMLQLPAEAVAPQPNPPGRATPGEFAVAVAVAGAGTATAVQNTKPKTLHDATRPAPETRVSLAFAGDIMLDEVPGRLIRRGRDPFAAVAKELARADFRIGNLESVVSRIGRAEPDKPFTFRAHPRVLPILARHFDAVSVANNHTGDYGAPAFADMLLRLKGAGIQAFGGGIDLADAHRPLILERRGLRIALLGYNDFMPRSFEADTDKPGSAWANEAQIRADIEAARTEYGAHLIIPVMHWGVEYEPLGNPRQRALARLMIDAGADAVVGGHPHVTQDIEQYRGKLIVYSLGNFLFNGFNTVPTTSGWLLRLELDPNGVRDWKILPVRLDRQGSPKPQSSLH